MMDVQLFVLLVPLLVVDDTAARLVHQTSSLAQTSIQSKHTQGSIRNEGCSECDTSVLMCVYWYLWIRSAALVKQHWQIKTLGIACFCHASYETQSQSKNEKSVGLTFYQWQLSVALPLTTIGLALKTNAASDSPGLALYSLCAYLVPAAPSPTTHHTMFSPSAPAVP